MSKLCKTREELYQYLKSLDKSTKKITPMSSVYFLIKHNGQEEVVYFQPYEGSYFESPCYLHAYEITEKELEEYVKDTYEKDSWDMALEYEKTLYIDGIWYKIDNPQCMLWLDKDIEVIDMLSERECLEWLLEYRAKK